MGMEQLRLVIMERSVQALSFQPVSAPARMQVSPQPPESRADLYCAPCGLFVLQALPKRFCNCSGQLWEAEAYS